MAARYGPMPCGLGVCTTPRLPATRASPCASGHFPDVEVLLDDGYLGLSRDHRGQAITPPRKPRPGALPGRVEQWERDRHGHSSDRITVGHALADHKRRKQLMRWTHRRDRLPDTYRAIAGLVSDRTDNA
ncbi:hypothetical protein RKD29_007799 [Streptomyces tendae]